VPRLRELLAQAEVYVAVRQLRVESNEAAEGDRFLGSPTLRVDGVDVDPSAGTQRLRLEMPPVPDSSAATRSAPDAWVLNALQDARDRAG
jgi:hypothetical protein